MLLEGVKDVIDVNVRGVHLDIFGQVVALVGLNDHGFLVFGGQLILGEKVCDLLVLLLHI